MKPIAKWWYVAGFILYYILFFTSLYFHLGYYDDPDSFYYDSISKHIEPSDNTFLGNALYYAGSDLGSIILFTISIFIAFIMFIVLYKYNPIRSQIASLFFLWSPTLLFNNSWFARMDKNMLEILLFCMFILIQLLYRHERFEWIGWLVLYCGCSLLFFTIGACLWQGSILFIVMTLMFIVLYELIVIKNKSKFFYIFMGLTSLVIGIIYLLRFPMNMQLVAEGQLNIYHYIFPEVILFLILWFSSARKMYVEYPKIFVISTIIFFTFIFLPRVMLFMIPMICIVYTLSGIKISRFGYAVILFSLSVFFIMNAIYFSQDHNKIIRDFPDPCITFNVSHCVIVSDWSNGHKYRNIWNETVMYTGHPSHLNEMLDYLYYKNMSCPKSMNCVYLWHPDDYGRFNNYVIRSGMNRTYQKIRTDMYASVDNPRYES